ncbi:hypothetical protein OL548_02560 [Lysinibacillus sp. MHQ-1]|nr:hypothetical protein OL548_02560 [Lysinibacillus sp. MHQ-1]
MAIKYNATREEVYDMTANMASRAAEVGLYYNFEKMKTAHTEKSTSFSKMDAAIWSSIGIYRSTDGWSFYGWGRCE